MGEQCPAGKTCVLTSRYADFGTCVWDLRSLIFSKLNVPQNKKAYKLDSLEKVLDYLVKEDPGSLSLSEFGISELPKEVMDEVQLQTLYLDDNNLTELPQELSLLKNLQTLSIQNNKIQNFPEVITELNNLEILILSGNELKNIPSSIAKLQKLRMLNITNNQIVQIPKEIALINSLQEMPISGNQISSLPVEFETVIKKLLVYDFCPNPIDVRATSQNILVTILNQSILRQPENYTETAEKGEGITHLARKAVDKYLTASPLRKAKRIASMDICLEDYLQNKLGVEGLKEGEQRIFSRELVVNAVFSCGFLEEVCPK